MYPPCHMSNSRSATSCPVSATIKPWNRNGFRVFFSAALPKRTPGSAGGPKELIAMKEANEKKPPSWSEKRFVDQTHDNQKACSWQIIRPSIWRSSQSVGGWPVYGRWGKWCRRKFIRCVLRRLPVSCPFRVYSSLRLSRRFWLCFGQPKSMLSNTYLTPMLLLSYNNQKRSHYNSTISFGVKRYHSTIQKILITF